MPGARRGGGFLLPKTDFFALSRGLIPAILRRVHLVASRKNMAIIKYILVILEVFCSFFNLLIFVHEAWAFPGRSVAGD